MRTPKALYNLTNNSAISEHLSENAWSAILDGRYKVEVQRTEPYKGVLCVWDARKNDTLIAEQEVGVSYDALFGADMSDVALWQEMACGFIDNANLPTVSRSN